MPGSPLWERMHARPRRAAVELRRDQVPVDSGVYAWYRDGAAIYVGKADSLLNRVWKKHLGKGRSMRGSAFRRNVAQHLGIATANDIYIGAYELTDVEVRDVRDFIEGCEVAWVKTHTKAAALELERETKREWMPPLTRT